MVQSSKNGSNPGQGGTPLFIGGIPSPQENIKYGQGNTPRRQYNIPYYHKNAPFLQDYIRSCTGLEPSWHSCMLFILDNYSPTLYYTSPKCN